MILATLAARNGTKIMSNQILFFRQSSNEVRNIQNQQNPAKVYRHFNEYIKANVSKLAVDITFWGLEHSNAFATKNTERNKIAYLFTKRETAEQY